VTAAQDGRPIDRTGRSPNQRRRIVRTTRRLTTTAAVVLAAGAAASPALAATQPRQDLRMPDTRDVAEGRVAPASPAPVVVRVQRGSDSGLSWDSAVIGAIGGAGVLACASGGVLLVARRRPSLR
jgi:hypothetical protein